MKNMLNKWVKFFNKDDSLFNYKQFINLMKKQNKGLMSKKQYLKISEELSKVSPCNLLVFGLGEDSYLWDNINKSGSTIFLEDSKEWIDTVNDGSLVIEHIQYSTSVDKHKEIGFDEQMGARPMARVMREKIRQELAEELLFGRLANGGQVVVGFDENNKKLLYYYCWY